MSQQSNPIDLQSIESALSERCIHYYPVFRSVPCQIRLLCHKSRAFNHLVEWEIASAGTRRRLITKWNRDFLGADQGAQREPAESYLVPGPDRPGAEYQAMKSVENRFSSTNDSCWFAVRVLDSLLDDRVLVLERANAQPLSRYLRRSAIGTPGSRPRVLQAVEACGSWLREFHQLPVESTCRLRGTTRSDFGAWTDRVCDRLSIQLPADRCDSLRRRLHTLTDKHLPKQLPIAYLHDDFAPRNVLVDRDGRVAGIDMAREWRGCVWEDLARFVVAVAVDKLRVFSGGMLLGSSWIEQLESAFFENYFETDSIPWAPLRLYQAQIALTSLAANGTTHTTWHSPARRLSARFLLAFIDARLTEIERARILRIPSAVVRNAEGGRG